MTNMKTGVELIAEERKEQIEKHNRSIEQDVKDNSNYQLFDGARVLLQKHAEGRVINPDKHPVEAEDDAMDYLFREMIPFEWNKEIWYKMFDKPYKDRLIIAGALIAAEIDRLNYDPQSTLTAQSGEPDTRQEECVHPYAWVERIVDYEKCNKCGKVLDEG